MSGDDLQYCRWQIWQKEAQISEQQNLRASYMEKAREIGRIYDKLAEKKDQAKQERSLLKKFAQTEYGNFRGSLFNGSYGPKVDLVVDEYSTLVTRIDRNLDMLNDERRRYENKAYQCDGIIGALERSVNYLNRTVQNWVN